jgi:hypothetical protein
MTNLDCVNLISELKQAEEDGRRRFERYFQELVKLSGIDRRTFGEAYVQSQTQSETILCEPEKVMVAR